MVLLRVSNFLGIPKYMSLFPRKPEVTQAFYIPLWQYLEAPIE